jgi:two-component SAPR family response regulator
MVDDFDYPLELLSSYKAGGYCLALLDIKMPQMSRFELHTKIKDIDDGVKTCLITAFDEFKNQFPYLKKKEYLI